MAFPVHQHESAVGIHVSPRSILNRPPTFLPTPSLQVVKEHETPDSLLLLSLSSVWGHGEMHPSTSPGESSLGNPVTQVPWPWTCSLQDCEMEISVVQATCLWQSVAAAWASKAVVLVPFTTLRHLPALPRQCPRSVWTVICCVASLAPLSLWEVAEDGACGSFAICTLCKRASYGGHLPLSQPQSLYRAATEKITSRVNEWLGGKSEWINEYDSLGWKPAEKRDRWREPRVPHLPSLKPWAPLSMKKGPQGRLPCCMWSPQDTHPLVGGGHFCGHLEQSQVVSYCSVPALPPCQLGWHCPVGAQTSASTRARGWMGRKGLKPASVSQWVCGTEQQHLGHSSNTKDVKYSSPSCRLSHEPRCSVQKNTRRAPGRFNKIQQD